MNLTPREIAVATLLTNGASNKQIAQKLAVSHSQSLTTSRVLLRKFAAGSEARLAVVLSSGFLVGQVFLPD